MSDTLDWNAKTIAEFRANQGKVGGVFEGAPLVLVHHRGRWARVTSQRSSSFAAARSPSANWPPDSA